MSPTASTFILISIAIWMLMTMAFGIAQQQRKTSIVDIAWGIGFALATSISFGLYNADTPRQLLVSGLVLVWATRLSIHIARRTRGKPDDHRYTEMRKKWSLWPTMQTYVRIYMLQGVCIILIASPVIALNTSPSIPPLTISDSVPFLLWCIGFVFESVGDYQLAQFKKQPENQGRILTTGLWRYTRHPNYFGEVCMWWAIFLLSFVSPGMLWTIISPLLITVLLIRVSGVPLLEKHYATNPEYQQYTRTTSSFFPWFPKKRVQYDV